MWRAYFMFGDLLACALTGAAAAGLVLLAVPADWSMVLGMAAGMGLGMALGMVGIIVFTPLFGALEVALPVMLSGMAAGMGAGMSLTMGPMTGLDAVHGGAGTGMAVFAFTYFLQAITRGEVKFRKGEG